jgi:hypothetical protein
MSADEEQPTLSQAGYQSVSPGFGATRSNVCANCGAQLQADQRYCVECGTRRGEARFKLADVPSAKGTPAAATAAAARGTGTGTGRWSAGLGLISVIAVLLLAVGVGVLIGHQGGSGSASNGTQKIVVSGTGSSGTAGAATAGAATAGTAAGSASAASSPSGATAGKSSSGTKAASNSSGAKATKKIVIKKPTQKELNAVKKAQGSSFSGTDGSQRKLASPTQKYGGSCTNGTAGCSNGKYNGSFFSSN